MNRHSPIRDGSVAMTPSQVNAEIRHRIIHAVESGKLRQRQVAERFGISSQRVSQIIREHRAGIERGDRYADKVTPSGRPMYEVKETGGYRWTKEALAELRSWIESGKTFDATAAAFGIDSRHVRRRAIAEQWVRTRTVEMEAKKQRAIDIAPEAKTFAEIARRVGLGVTTVRETIKRRAPREHLRMCGVVASSDELADERAADPLCWHSRAADLFPHDPALVRSLARAASFVTTTKDGVTVRLVPHRCQGVVA